MEDMKKILRFANYVHVIIMNSTGAKWGLTELRGRASGCQIVYMYLVQISTLEYW